MIYLFLAPIFTESTSGLLSSVIWTRYKWKRASFDRSTNSRCGTQVGSHTKNSVTDTVIDDALKYDYYRKGSGSPISSKTNHSR